MAYIKDVWRFPGSNEYEYKYAGNYGAKGEKRRKRQKASPEQIKRQNKINKEKKVRRLIKANFKRGDLWTTLKYPAGTRKTFSEVKKDFEKFRRNLRGIYKKLKQEFKYIYRIEVGALGGIHIHILINRIHGADTDVIIQSAWKYGIANHESIYDAGGYAKLANYIVKLPEEGSEEYEQLSLFPDQDKKEMVKYSTSRNLIRPEAERTHYQRWTMRKAIEDGPTPSKGYFIDKDSIVYGINPYTGMSYLHYTEFKITKHGPPGGTE